MGDGTRTAGPAPIWVRALPKGWSSHAGELSRGGAVTRWSRGHSLTPTASFASRATWAWAALTTLARALWVSS